MAMFAPSGPITEPWQRQIRHWENKRKNLSDRIAFPGQSLGKRIRLGKQMNHCTVRILALKLAHR